MSTTNFGTFAHELGHQNSANKGSMDMNTLNLALQGNTNSWIRIKDEKSADNFANSVTGGEYNGYDFDESDQKAYDNAVQNLKK